MTAGVQANRRPPGCKSVKLKEPGIWSPVRIRGADPAGTPGRQDLNKKRRLRVYVRLGLEGWRAESEVIGGRKSRPVGPGGTNPLREYSLLESRPQASRRRLLFPVPVPVLLPGPRLRHPDSGAWPGGAVFFLPVSSAGPIPGSFLNFCRLGCSLPTALLFTYFQVIIA